MSTWDICRYCIRHHCQTKSVMEKDLKGVFNPVMRQKRLTFKEAATTGGGGAFENRYGRDTFLSKVISSLGPVV